MSMPITAPSLPTFKILSFPRLTLQTRNQTIPFHSSLIKTQAFNPKPTYKRLLLLRTRNLGFCVNAENGRGESKDGVNDAEMVARGESTMPERFRYLSKEAPDPPILWPWFVALGFLIYAWRAVLFELGNWRKAALAIVGFVGYLMKILLAFIFHFVGDPITSMIRCVETAIYTVRAFYSSIVTNAPVPELTMIIILASSVIAIAEAAVPNSAICQPYLLTFSGVIGYAAVRSYISEPLFWTLLLGLYGFSQVVKKRDNVTSALPVAAVLAAIGEPWVRVLAIVLFMALAISQHSNKLSDGKDEIEVATTGKRVPVPLLCAALAIGIRLAAKWAGYWHLTWMIV
uniref:Uncharacterized protein MANES_13G151300 n=1 Tax=Rhizophora mucronata TaxID=61149 RepID=A0A2P2NRG3_RHIMU